MPTNPALRVTLGDLHGLYEAVCARAGVSITQGLAGLIDAARPAPPAARRPPVHSVSYRSPEQQEAFRQLARESRRPAGAFLRLQVEQVLRTVIEGGAIEPSRQVCGGAIATPCPHTLEPSRRRIELRLSASEFDALATSAAKEGFRSPQEFMVATLRAHLTDGAVIGAGAAAAIGQHNLQLLRISSKLAEIVRSAAVSAPAISEVAEDLQRTRTLIEQHMRVVSQLLTESRSRTLLEPISDGALNEPC